MKKIISMLIVAFLSVMIIAPSFAMNSEEASNENMQEINSTAEEREAADKMFNDALKLYENKKMTRQDTKLQKAKVEDQNGNEYTVDMFPVEESNKVTSYSDDGTTSYEQSYIVSFESKYMEPVNQKVSTRDLSYDDMDWDKTGSMKCIVTIYYDRPVSNKYKLTGVKSNFITYQSGVYMWEMYSRYYCNGTPSLDRPNEMLQQEGTVGTIYNNHYFSLDGKVGQHIYVIHSAFNRVGAITVGKLAKGTSYWEMQVPCFVINDVADLPDIS